MVLRRRLQSEERRSEKRYGRSVTAIVIGLLTIQSMASALLLRPTA